MLKALIMHLKESSILFIELMCQRPLLESTFLQGKYLSAESLVLGSYQFEVESLKYLKHIGSQTFNFYFSNIYVYISFVEIFVFHFS